MSRNAEERNFPDGFIGEKKKAPTMGARQTMPSYIRELWDEAAPIFFAAQLAVRQELEARSAGIDPARLGARIIAHLIREATEELTERRLARRTLDTLNYARRYADGPGWVSYGTDLQEILNQYRAVLGSTLAGIHRFSDERSVLSIETPATPKAQNGPNP